jgi:hypothetical protein
VTEIQYTNIILENVVSLMYVLLFREKTSSPLSDNFYNIYGIELFLHAKMRKLQSGSISVPYR